VGDAHAPRSRRWGACGAGRSLVALGVALGIAPGIALGSVLGAALVVGVVGACGSKGVGIDVCKQIETARCQAAPDCGVMIAPPDYYTSGTAAEACIRYYDVACLNGLQVAAPTSAEVTACLDAINTGCAYVSTPQDSPACAWLSTTDAGENANVPDVVDAADAADAPAADVTTDAEVAAD
jgi:hypothetical protein